PRGGSLRTCCTTASHIGGTGGRGTPPHPRTNPRTCYGGHAAVERLGWGSWGHRPVVDAGAHHGAGDAAIALRTLGPLARLDAHLRPGRRCLPAGVQLASRGDFTGGVSCIP